MKYKKFLCIIVLNLMLICEICLEILFLSSLRKIIVSALLRCAFASVFCLMFEISKVILCCIIVMVMGILSLVSIWLVKVLMSVLRTSSEK